MIDEQILIERSLQGEIEAFDQLVLEYQGLIYSIAYRMLQDQNAAADATQDSFIKAFRALKTFHGGNFKAWLTRIVTNTCYDVLRLRQRRTTTNLDESAGEQEHSPYLVDKAESPELHAERMELNQFIESAIHSLPAEQRIVVTLCDIHGYSYEEISEITDLPMGTVKSRISRARTKLRDFLQRQPELLPVTFRPSQ